MEAKAQRKRRERAARRELLLEAAEQVFGQKPYDEASVQEVAALAGLGMQGLYEVFPSKQMLYEALVVERATAFQSLVERAVEGIEEPLDQLRAIARVKVEMVRSHPAFFAVFLKERIQWEWQLTSRFSGRFFEIYEAERGRLRAILERLIAQGRLQPLDAEFLVQLCAGCLQASLLYMRRDRPGEEVDACVERAMESFLSGVGVRP